MGVPLFQEQLMQMAIDVAGFTPAESDELRRAMGSKRSMERMNDIRDRLYAGMAGNGITGPLADDLYGKLAAFANYGFPESHAMSFAYLVYASAWLKRYHPAAFCAALLNAQPMGFYSPQSLVDDARRHGVSVRRPDINASNAKAILEPPLTEEAPPGRAPDQWGRGGPVVRLGLSSVRTLGDAVAERIEAERIAGGSYLDMTDLARRAGLTTAHLEALATADAFAGFGLSRREALWARGRGGPGAGGPAAGHHDRGRRADAARDGRGRANGRRRLGDRAGPGCAPGPVRPRVPGPDRGRFGRRAARGRARPPGPGRRGRHPPAAPGHRGRGHVHQP